MSSNTKQTILNALHYWHSQEFFVPQPIESPVRINGKTPLIKAFRGVKNEVIEWINEQAQENSDSHHWHFSIYGGIYKIEDVRNELVEFFKVNDNIEERPTTGEGASYVFNLNRSFQIDAERLFVSTAPWALKHVKSNHEELKHENFKIMEEEIRNFASTFAEINLLKTSALEELNQRILEEIGAIDLCKTPEVLQVVAVRRKESAEEEKKEEDKESLDALNSFYIEDLEKCIQSVKEGRSNVMLEMFLNVDETRLKNRRIDLRGNIAYKYAMLSPDKFPDGCWPTTGGHPMVFSQQFALNNIVERIGRNEGFYSVDGPPGTGKTTLLRDLIAHVVTERAKIIASYENFESLFTNERINTWKTSEFQRQYYPLIDAMLGYEIVVASSNNGAVENITLEIPLLDKIDPKWHGQIDFFREYGTEIVGENTWGSGAVCLGNGANKNSFFSKYWFSHKDKNGDEFVGFQEYLKEVKNLSRGVLDQEWQIARKAFLDAIARVARLKRGKMDLSRAFVSAEEKMASYKTQITQKLKKVKECEESIEFLKKQNIAKTKESQEHLESWQKRNVDLVHVADEVAQWEEKYNKWRVKAKRHKAAEMGTIDEVLDMIFTFGKKKRRYYQATSLLREEGATIKAHLAGLKELKLSYEKDIESLKTLEKLTFEESKQALKEIEKENAKKSALVMEAKGHQEQYAASERDSKALKERLSAVSENLSNDADSDANRELSSPWMDEEFYNARSEVFIRALNLHKAFIRANAAKIHANLFCVMDILSGNAKNDSDSSRAVRHAWATLFLCIPVISTTLASFPRIFSRFWNNELGWLLIDEAGQAPVHSALGAVMRSKRCVTTGDPLQLEPIIGLPTSVQEVLRVKSGAHESFLSQHTSVQKRADAIEPCGVYIERPDEDPLWIGSPLRVHRRCDSPMFEISNITTYGGLMINGKKNKDSLLPKSQWIDVESNDSEGHWIQAEGEVVMEHIKKLRSLGVDPRDIYVISPFKDVVSGLKRLFKPHSSLLDFRQIGTIHTVQGKEARVVCFVLGGDSANEGARIWASAKPNLLNVANSRGKERLYIIGNRKKWSNKKFFTDADYLLKLHTTK